MKKNKTLRNLLKALFALAIFTNTGIVSAQELSKDDSLKNEINIMKNDVAFLKKFKFSGYMQGQFQVAEKVGEASYSGGNFGSTTDKRFMMRRARLKLNYAETTQNLFSSSMHLITEIILQEIHLQWLTVLAQFRDRITAFLIRIPEAMRYQAEMTS